MRLQASVGVAAILFLTIAGLVVWRGVGSDSNPELGSNDGGTFVIAEVERRDLADQITVRGEIRRDELQRITSGIDGRLSSVVVQDGDTIEAGDVIYALDGRAAVAVIGNFSFFRQLDVGSDGPDVQQLETILAQQGYGVGIVDQLFTEETRSGLGEWQVDHGYGGATPEPDENIIITLQNNPAGYTVGARNTTSVLLGPTVPDAVADITGADDEESLGSGGSTGPSFLVAQSQPDVPVIEVTVAPAEVAEGERATFTFTSDVPMPTDTVIDYAVAGSATAGDDYDDSNLDGTFIFPAGTSSFELATKALKDKEIETDEDLTITVGTGIINNPNENYALGPLKEATLIITSPDDEEEAGISVFPDQDVIDEGGTLGFTFRADQIRNEPTTIFFRLGGTAANGSDYTQIDEFKIELPAGAETVTLSIQTRDDSLVESDETVVVELNTKKKKAEYHGLDPQTASATIQADPNDLPELTLEGETELGEGESAAFTILADQAMVVDTSINYSVAGTATPGLDYQELTGTVIMLAGQDRVDVRIRTLDDDVIFRPGDMIVADWPARVGTVSVDEGEFILQGQEVLTLTEPNFTIALLLSPTDRGRLEVGLAVTVELQASDEDAVEGIISELDDTATVDSAGNETYEGVVAPSQPLKAIDGAGVNIEVTLEERINVVTVPVAAVLQNGEGHDVVRVVLADGTTRQIEVDVGLSEGAFVEIRSGIAGDELVLVET